MLLMVLLLLEVHCLLCMLCTVCFGWQDYRHTCTSNLLLASVYQQSSLLRTPMKKFVAAIVNIFQKYYMIWYKHRNGSAKIVNSRL